MTKQQRPVLFLRLQILTIVALQFLVILSGNQYVFWTNIIVLAGFLLLNVFQKHYDFLNLSLLFFAIHISTQIPILKYWNLVSGFAIYTLTVMCLPALRSNQNWLRLGKINKRSLIYLLVTIVLSSSALVLWYALSSPDLSPMTKMIESQPWWIKIAAIILFAIINAITEESIFDGVMFHASEKMFRTPILIILIPALSYSIVHFYGIPSGIGGVVLSFIYGGIMLGVLRFSTGGILMPVLAHIAADMVIAALAFGFLS